MGEAEGSDVGLGARLGRRLDDLWGGPVTVTEIRRLTGGASFATWAATVDGPGRRGARVVLRLGRAGTASSCTLERRVIEAASRAGVPVPGIIDATDDEGTLGGPYVLMEWVDGETIPRRIHRDPDLADVRAGFAGDCGRILGALSLADHTMAGLEAEDPLPRYRATLDQLGTPVPTFEWAFRHLAATRPATGRVALVHGDFRLGNLMVGPGGVRAVLDWELVHRGDPLEDLGWLSAPSWRFGGPGDVGGLGDEKDLLAAYAGVTGVEVDPGELRWWQTVGTLRWGVMCLAQAGRHLGGEQRSVELAAIGRRVAEVESDLLGLLP